MSADNANKIDISPLTVVVSEALDPRVRRKLEAEQQADVKTYEELTRSMQVQEDLNKIRQQVDSKDADEADPFKQPEATENTAPAQEPANPAPAPAPEATPAAAPEAGAQPAAAPAADTKAPEQNAVIDKYARKFVGAMSGQFRKDIALSGALITHSMKVAAVFLTYGERSVAQYGS